MFHYIDGGADDEWSLTNNTAAFERYSLIPRVLRDVSAPDTRCRVLGCESALPIITAPTGMARLFHHEKEFAVARAAAACGIPYSLSTMATSSIEDIAQANPGPKIFQIYIHRDRGLTRELADRARAAGYTALALTVDTPMGGNRERDLRTGMVMPPRWSWRSALSFALHPVWSFNLLRYPDFRLANVVHRVDALAGGAMSLVAYVNAQFDRALVWDDVEDLIAHWNGPFALKGVMHPEDARRARDVGATALMVSNHGGRQLDGAPAPIDCLAPIREAVGDSLELILDGGVRRGTQILKALQAGATACSVGRPVLYGLAAGGEAGVRRALQILKDELLRDMTLAGWPSLRGPDG